MIHPRPPEGLGLAHILRQRLLSFGDSVAIGHGQNIFTFNEIHHRALSIAKVLQSHSVQNEQPVSIIARRVIDHILCQVAVIFPSGLAWWHGLLGLDKRFLIVLCYRFASYIYQP